MRKTLLYDLLSMGIFHEWREAAAKERIDCFEKREKETKEKLLTALPESVKDAVSVYALAIEDRMDFLYYNLNARILNLGIQLGMEIQQSISLNNED